MRLEYKRKPYNIWWCLFCIACHFREQETRGQLSRPDQWLRAFNQPVVACFEATNLPVVACFQATNQWLRASNQPMVACFNQWLRASKQPIPQGSPGFPGVPQRSPGVPREPHGEPHGPKVDLVPPLIQNTTKDTK